MPVGSFASSVSVLIFILTYKWLGGPFHLSQFYPAPSQASDVTHLVPREFEILFLFFPIGIPFDLGMAQ